MKPRKYTEEQLKKAVNDSFSLAQTLKTLGLIPCGGNYLVIKRAIAFFNLDISHFTGQLWNKGKKTGARQSTENYYNNNVRISSYKLKKRLISDQIFPSECSSCKRKKWLTQPFLSFAT